MEQVSITSPTHTHERRYVRAGAIVILAALGLPFLPYWFGVSLMWTVIMAIVAAVLLTADQPAVKKMLPPKLDILTAALILTVVVMLLRVRLDVVGLLWVAATALLGWAYYLRHPSLLHGMDRTRKYMVIGLAVCLITLAFPWGGYTGSAATIPMVSPRFTWNPGTGGMYQANNYILLQNAFSISYRGINLPYALLVALALSFALISWQGRRHKFMQWIVVVAAAWWVWMLIGAGIKFTAGGRVAQILFAAGLACIVYSLRVAPHKEITS